jgi:hypothetical protein
MRHLAQENPQPLIIQILTSAEEARLTGEDPTSTSQLGTAASKQMTVSLSIREIL